MKSENTLRRLLGGMSGHAAMRATLMVQSVVLVPVLIAGWGVEGYGAWLALMALGSYAGVTNFGLTDASGSAMLLATGAGDTVRAQAIFSTTLAALLLLAVPVQMLVAGMVIFLPIRSWLNLELLTQRDIVLTMLLLAGQVWLVTLKGLFAAAIATTGRFGLSNALSAGTKLVEILATAVLVFFFHGTILDAAMIVVVIALVDLIVQAVTAWRLVHWVGGLRLRIERVMLATLIRPSLGNLVLQMGVNAIVVQGPRIALAALAGPVVVAAFAVHVTAARLTQQVVSMLAGPMMLEMSMAIGRSDRERALDLLVAGVHATILIGVVFLSVASIAGIWVIPIWTTRAVTFQPALFAIVGIMTLANNAASIPLGVLIGANRVLRAAVEMTFAGAIAIALGAALVPVLGAKGMALGCALAEFTFLAIVLRRVTTVLHRSTGSIVQRLLEVDRSARQGWHMIRAVDMRRLRKS